MTLVRSEEVRVDEMIAGAGIPEMAETAEIAEARAEEIFEVGDAREEVVMIVAAEGRVAEDGGGGRAEGECGEAAEHGVGVEEVGFLEDGGAGFALLSGVIGEEVDGVLGDAEGLIGVGGQVDGLGHGRFSGEGRDAIGRHRRGGHPGLTAPE